MKPALILVLALLTPSVAEAQSEPPPALFELSPGIGLLSRDPAVTLTLSTNVTPRLAVEAGALGTQFTDGLRGYYVLQARFRVTRRAPIYVTVGTAGTLESRPVHARQTSLPDGSMLIEPGGSYRRLGKPLGNVGIAFGRQLGRRIGFRADVQVIAGVDHDFIGFIRAGASLSIPIGGHAKGGSR